MSCIVNIRTAMFIHLEDLSVGVSCNVWNAYRLSETELTARVLKKDQKHKEVKKNAF